MNDLERDFRRLERSLLNREKRYCIRNSPRQERSVLVENERSDAEETRENSHCHFDR